MKTKPKELILTVLKRPDRPKPIQDDINKLRDLLRQYGYTASDDDIEWAWRRENYFHHWTWLSDVESLDPVHYLLKYLKKS